MNIKSIKQIAGAAAIILAVTALVAVLVIRASADPVSEECKALSAQLKEYGAAVESCEYDAQTNRIRVELCSAAESISADDISVIRAARNVVRYEMNTLKTLSGAARCNEVMKNADGKTLLDSESDLQTVPPFPECAALRANIPSPVNTDELREKLNREYPDISASASYNENTGTTLHILLDYDDTDFDKINETAAELMRAVGSFNADTAAVQQTEITVTAAGEKVLYISADLIYRDFLWWQTPQMPDAWVDY